eukprot:756092-Hanusia_phi.AAC.5
MEFAVVSSATIWSCTNKRANRSEHCEAGNKLPCRRCLQEETVRRSGLLPPMRTLATSDCQSLQVNLLPSESSNLRPNGKFCPCLALGSSLNAGALQQVGGSHVNSAPWFGLNHAPLTPHTPHGLLNHQVDLKFSTRPVLTTVQPHTPGNSLHDDLLWLEVRLCDDNVLGHDGTSRATTSTAILCWREERQWQPVRCSSRGDELVVTAIAGHSVDSFPTGLISAHRFLSSI